MNVVVIWSLLWLHVQVFCGCSSEINQSRSRVSGSGSAVVVLCMKINEIVNMCYCSIVYLIEKKKIHYV